MINILIFSLLTLFSGFETDVRSQFKSEQLVVVTTNSWNAIEGKMTFYEWKKGKWTIVLADIPIVAGRSGLAWGKGLHQNSLNKGKLKKEGDGNAPAGIFYLDGLFGYSDITAKMKSLKVDKQTFCVDDVNSEYYNRIVKSDTVKKDWKSAETMRMKSDVYKYGIFVDYNTNPPVPGKGSCIFMHIWSGKTAPTAGCTAMAEQNILKLIRLLDPNKRPLLVQVPRQEYTRLKSQYKLP